MQRILQRFHLSPSQLDYLRYSLFNSDINKELWIFMGMNMSLTKYKRVQIGMIALYCISNIENYCLF